MCISFLCVYFSRILCRVHFWMHPSALFDFTFESTSICQQQKVSRISLFHVSFHCRFQSNANSSHISLNASIPHGSLKDNSSAAKPSAFTFCITFSILKHLLSFWAFDILHLPFPIRFLRIDVHMIRCINVESVLTHASFNSLPRIFDSFCATLCQCLSMHNNCIPLVANLYVHQKNLTFKKLWSKI